MTKIHELALRQATLYVQVRLVDLIICNDDQSNDSFYAQIFHEVATIRVYWNAMQAPLATWLSDNNSNDLAVEVSAATLTGRDNLGYEVRRSDILELIERCSHLPKIGYSNAKTGFLQQLFGPLPISV